MKGSGFGTVMDIVVGIIGGFIMRAPGFADQGGFDLYRLPRSRRCSASHLPHSPCDKGQDEKSRATVFRSETDLMSGVRAPRN